MENTLYIGLSRMVALREQVNLIANNIANMTTPGYKATKIMFEEYLEKPKSMKDGMSMVLDYGNFKVKSNGPLQMTGNSLDLAIQGPGYFGVQGQNGKTMYTRAGNFTLDANRTVVTPQGRPVLDAGGATITIPEGQNNIMIDETGQIATEGGVVGQVMVKEFANIQKLIPVGENLYTSDDAGVASPTSKITQGALEGSNVQGVLEMSDMIEVSRDYQSVSRMMQNEHDRLRNAIRTLSSGQG